MLAYSGRQIGVVRPVARRLEGSSLQACASSAISNGREPPAATHNGRSSQPRKADAHFQRRCWHATCGTDIQSSNHSCSKAAQAQCGETFPTLVVTFRFRARAAGEPTDSCRRKIRTSTRKRSVQRNSVPTLMSGKFRAARNGNRICHRMRSGPAIPDSCAVQRFAGFRCKPLARFALGAFSRSVNWQATVGERCLCGRKENLLSSADHDVHPVLGASLLVSGQSRTIGWDSLPCAPTALVTDNDESQINKFIDVLRLNRIQDLDRNAGHVNRPSMHFIHFLGRQDILPTVGYPQLTRGTKHVIGNRWRCRSREGHRHQYAGKLSLFHLPLLQQPR
jgi:hypothetical protein